MHSTDRDRIYEVTSNGLEILYPSFWAKTIKYLGNGIFGTVSDQLLENSNLYNNMYSLESKEVYADGYTDICRCIQMYKGLFVRINISGEASNCDFVKMDFSYNIGSEII